MCKTNGIKSPLVFCVNEICQMIPCKEKRCDEIMLCDAARGATGVYCIENKKRKPANIKIQKTVAQLQGGADIVAKYLDEEEKFRFMPVLVNRRGVLPTFRGELARKSVLLRNISARIRIARGKSPILPALR